jgi:hypothetical protein
MRTEKEIIAILAEMDPYTFSDPIEDGEEVPVYTICFFCKRFKEDGHVSCIWEEAVKLSTMVK